MPFDPIDPRQSFPDLERGILQYWKEEDLFKRSIRQRSKTEGDLLDGPKGDQESTFSFYDGPPFATGLPHYGHILAGTIKDVIPRYQTMRGKRVERRFGWDCHGLPIENMIEKEHGLKTKNDIEVMGVRAFNDLCRASVQRYAGEWRKTVERMGRWVDMDHDYRTMDPSYMESIWWVFSELHKKGLIYEGHKPMHICPRCQTPLSNFEVTQGYKDITDQSAYVKFALTEAKNTYVLAWTTTPWTLPGNLFLAVGKKIAYVQVACDGAQYILAESRVEHAFKGLEHTIVKKLKSSDLVGKTYTPLFPYFVAAYEKSAFKIVEGDFVTTEDGTGIVHIAPGFGEDDFEVGKREGVPLLQHVGMDGTFVSAVKDFAGLDVKPKDDPSKTDRVVIEWLKAHDLLFKSESYKHSYPHCWRCDTPLLNYATGSWFVTMEKIKKQMLLSNKETEWVPAHLRDGRFGKWLEGARDWAISRNRYWGTPLPIWRAPEGTVLDVIESREDLMKRKLLRFTKVTLVRHGESEGNLIPIYQGKVPGTKLTTKGKAQARAAAALLKDSDVSHVYASPLKRTQETAGIIAKKVDATVKTDDRLREVEFGKYEGTTVDFSDLALVRQKRAQKLQDNSLESIYHFPEMESWMSVSERTSAFLKEILPMHRGQHIVIVTHADPVQVMKHFFTQEDPIKISHQPYPGFAVPHSFYWDHDMQAEMDLHKETVDEITWPGAQTDQSVEVTFVRHGQTDWNVDQRIQGWSVDPKLTELGKSQAKALAEAIKDQKFDVFLCSDFARTKETAAILNSVLNMPIEYMELLRERNFGDASGMTVPEFLAQHPSPIDSTHIALHPHTSPNGESLSQFLTRAEQIQAMILKRFPGKKVLVVTHGGIVQAMHGIVLNLSHEAAIMSAPNNCEAKTLTLNPLMKRIPEVLDCWFESGSMPYAQSHFPFSYALGPISKKKKSMPPGFPADFIAEGIDQTRGWFYTLTVLSSALFKQPAFRHCIVNGTVLAEDGKKMSKRLKNYPEPLEIVEKYGADAVRFALMSSPAVRAEDLRFSAKLVEETLRNTLLPLWNTASFFVTYANAAGFTPEHMRRPSEHPLDVWIRTEVQDLVNRMTQQLENYDLSATCSELQDAIDGLTNWYVRLSRRRFAGKAAMHSASPDAPSKEDTPDEERTAALQTLYDVLLTLSQLLAPFCPYITDAIYLNFVNDPHGSIHLSDWPMTRSLTDYEQTLLTRTRLLRTIVSLGLSIRSDQKIKLRQPLAKAIVAIPDTLLHGQTLTEEEMKLLREEINVKQIEITHSVGALAQAILQVDARQVGPRLGGRVQEVILAAKQGEFTVLPDGSYQVLDITLAPSEAKVVYKGLEGQNVAANQGVVVSIDTAVSDELKLEGLARDLIRAIQQARKEAGYSVSDMIKIMIEGGDAVLDSCQDLILRETNATLAANDGAPQTVDIDGQSVTFRFSKL